MIKRKTYLKGFKPDAITFVREESDCISEAARNLDVSD